MKMRFAAVHESGDGTFETWLLALKTSAIPAGADVIGARKVADTS